jgi:hypothetical protein
MFRAEGKDGVIPTLGDEWCNPNLGSGETSVWMFCGLGKSMKNYVVIS